MNLSEVINLAYQTATGKTKMLNPGNSKYERMLNIANMANMQWESEPDVIWGSLCEDREIGVIDDSTSYKLPEDVRTVDFRKFITLTKESNNWTVPFISPQLFKGGCYGVLQLGWKLDFNGLTEEMKGAKIIAPVIRRTKKLVEPEDKVEIDDPYWLVYMIAAEFVRNSRTKSNQYGNLVTLAQSSMEGMKNRNGYKFDEVIREDIWL
ncbi:MAG: hypothetical protein NNC23_02035 [Candidatus Nanosynbacter sp. P2B_S1_bin.0.1]|nr:hypothetical protein [Candidatus Nanosynbacter sp. P2B_S1_bin.0.1]